jgi:hypothetical protein
MLVVFGPIQRSIDIAQKATDNENGRALFNAAAAILALDRALDPAADSDGDGIYIFDHTSTQDFRVYVASWPMPQTGASDFQVRIDTNQDSISVVLIDDEAIPLQDYDSSLSSFVDAPTPTEALP